jgi:hypothetical protein
MLHVCIFLCLVFNVTPFYLSVSCVQCYPCLSFCVLGPMINVSIFVFLVFNATRVYLSVSCVQCYPCLSFCFLCPMLALFIFLCLVSNVTHVYPARRVARRSKPNQKVVFFNFSAQDVLLDAPYLVFSYLEPLGFLLPRISKLYGFPINWIWSSSNTSCALKLISTFLFGFERPATRLAH